MGWELAAKLGCNERINTADYALFNLKNNPVSSLLKGRVNGHD
jgi:hypothetical protein